MAATIDWTSFNNQPVPKVSKASSGSSVFLTMTHDGLWTATSSDRKVLEKFLKDMVKPEPELVVPAGVQLHYLTEETESKRRRIVVAFIEDKESKSVLYQSCIHNNTHEKGKQPIKFDRTSHGYTALKRLQRRPIRLSIGDASTADEIVKLIRKDMPRHSHTKAVPECSGSIFSN